jgi:hypothetical protein
VPATLVLSEPTFPFRAKSRYDTMRSAILSKPGVWAKGCQKAKWAEVHFKWS